MSILDDLKRLEAADIVLYVSLLLATACPGTALLYVYAPNLVVAIATAKLVLLALTLALPVFLANYILTVLFVESPDERFLLELPGASFVTAAAFYAALLAAALLHLRFRIFLVLLVIADALFFLFLRRYYRKHRRAGSAD